MRAWHEKRNFTAELQLVWSMNGVRFTVNELPALHQLEVLLSEAWGTASETDWSSVLSRSICFVCSYEGDQLIGFVNVAWDGGLHASIFDTTVHPRFQRQGIGVELVKKAIEEARLRGAKWLHVDFEPHLAHFYVRCGFRPTQAGLIPLRG